jgi:hypothetical protein
VKDLARKVAARGRQCLGSGTLMNYTEVPAIPVEENAISPPVAPDDPCPIARRTYRHVKQLPVDAVSPQAPAMNQCHNRRFGGYRPRLAARSALVAAVSRMKIKTERAHQDIIAGDIAKPDTACTQTESNLARELQN